MNKELKKFSDEELLTEIIKRSGSKKGLPTKAKCFLCSKEFWIKWNSTTQSPSKIHSWEYWANEPTKDKICRQCLHSLRAKNPSCFSEIKDKKLKRIYSAYLTSGRI